MRSHKLFFVIAFVAAITAIALFAGCSSDKSTTPAADDSGLALASAEFNTATDSLISQFGNALTLISSTTEVDTAITIVYSPVNPDSTVTEGTWHVVYASDLVAGYTRYLIDSIQFRAVGHPVSTMTGADQVVVLRHWGINNPDTTTSYRNEDVTSIISATGLLGQTASISATRTSTVVLKIDFGTSSVKRTYVNETTVSNLTVPKANGGWAKGCPQSGTISGNVQVTIDRGTVPVTTNWTYDVTADNGVLTGTVTAGAVSVDFTRDACQM